MVTLEQRCFVFATNVNRHALAHEITDVVSAAATATGLEVDDPHIVALAEEQVVEAIVEVHNRVGHCGEAIK